MALKKPQPKMDPQEFLDLFKEAMDSGAADTLLPSFFDVIDARIRWYQGSEGSKLDEELYTALQVQRKFMDQTNELHLLNFYGLLGTSYRGVVVELIERLHSTQECRVRVTEAPDGQLVVDATYKVPEGALVPVPE